MGRTVWLLESVGGGPSTAAALCWARMAGRAVIYCGGSPRLLALWRRRFPPGDFQEIEGRCNLEEGTHLDLYRSIEARAAELEAAPLFKALREFMPHPKLGAVLRKQIIGDVYLQHMLCREARRRLDDGEAVVLLPKDGRTLVGGEPARVPPLWRALLSAASRLEPLAFLAVAAWRLLRNGVAWRLPAPAEWAVAQTGSGSSSERGQSDDGLIYGDGELAPERILHVLKDPPSEEYLRFARERRIPVAYPRALRPPLVFVARRLLGGYLLLALRALRDSSTRRAPPDLVRAVLRLGLFELETELLTLHHRSRVYFGFDTYGTMSDVRAMVWDRLGAKYVGYMHGTTPLPLYFYHDTYAPILICSGKATRRRYGETLKNSRVLPLGLMSAELALRGGGAAERLRAEAKGRHLVAAFDSSFSPFWGFTAEVYDVFFTALLDLVERQPDVLLCLKRKYAEENPAYDRLAARIEGHPRVKVVFHESAYGLIFAADSVIAVGASTVGWEALSCRKPTFFLDPRAQFRGHPAWRYGPPLVSHTPAELIERFSAMREGRYLEPALWDRIVAEESRFAEESPLTDVRNLLLREAGARVHEQQGQPAL